MGASRRCTMRVPPSAVGAEGEGPDRPVLADPEGDLLLRARRSVTIACVGQTSRPLPVDVDHLGALARLAAADDRLEAPAGSTAACCDRSETSSQTVAGGAAISIEASMGATSVSGTGFSSGVDGHGPPRSAGAVRVQPEDRPRHLGRPAPGLGWRPATCPCRRARGGVRTFAVRDGLHRGGGRVAVGLARASRRAWSRPPARSGARSSRRRARGAGRRSGWPAAAITGASSGNESLTTDAEDAGVAARPGAARARARPRYRRTRRR